MRRPDPARGFRIELSEHLQLSIALLGQQLDAHRGSHFNGAVLRLVFLPRRARFRIVTDTSASFWAFRRAVTEDQAGGILALASYVGLATRRFHLLERPECIGIAFEPRLYIGPRDARMPLHVLLKASLQCLDELITF